MAHRPETRESAGPLEGVRVIELAGIGPGPHACMILADLGAEVIRIERTTGSAGPPVPRSADITLRGRSSVALDLKSPAAVRTVLTLAKRADVLIEGFRPGVTERLGLGPEECLRENPRLIYGRITGWGQTGPLAGTAGHDVNYLAVSGVLHGLGQDASRPHYPSNLLGDYGAGSTYLVIGVLAALHERTRSGVGQVVDAAILDGAAHLNAITSSLLAADKHVERRGVNTLGGGAPYYDVYETKDREHMAVGALESPFFAEFLRRMDLEEYSDRSDPSGREELRTAIAERFRSRTRSEWTEVFGASDACVTPVLRLSEAPEHPHVSARGTFVKRGGIVQPAPTPRFSRTPPDLPPPPRPLGSDTVTTLRAWGVENVDRLLEEGSAYQANNTITHAQ
ncbi:CaiB/BaiF CoA transferase family protein [Microbacterium sp. A93]|uniref:CaiB/BaiF CoA transferase family protein n=1 Tax=Microbacterium sp. A93 TaxID=3450716 RepID=UPI003F41DDAE